MTSQRPCDVSTLTSAAGRPQALRLGSVAVAPPVVLAPMSGLTTSAMRSVSEQCGCGLTITEFLAAPALAARVPKELSKLAPSRDGRPFGAQIFGRHPQQVGVSARFAREKGAFWVDINMGCPARKVTKGVAGAALMREPALAAELVAAAREGAGPETLVSVKIRSGWDSEHKNAPQFAAQMVAAGAALVSVHGRTRQQAYAGTVDLEAIRRVKEAVPVPVIGNGDVVDIPSIERMFEHTGCDGVMVGRAALGNPWIFAEFKAWWLGQPLPPPPTLRARLEMYLHHLDLYLETSDEPRAVIEMRKFASWYLRGFAGASSLRKTLYRTSTVADVHNVIAGSGLLRTAP